jgi:hypothetical protein
MLSVSTSASDIAPELAAAQAERILASEVFRDSPTQQRLFRYIVQESLSGSHRDLKEYNIGVSVFQRGADFDPRTDSIVRVQMGVLRKRLQQYYAGAGSTDTLLIEVPKGHYVARFLPRQNAFEVVQPQDTPAPIPVAKQRALRPLVYGVAGLVLGAFVMYLLLSKVAPVAETHSSAAGLEAREHPLWKTFLASGSTSTLVVGAPMFIELRGLYIRDSHINEPEEIKRSPEMRQLEAVLHGQGRPSDIYTGLGEVVSVNLLGQFFQAASCNLPLLRNRLTRWQDVTSGNLIFVASLRFHTLNQELNLPSDFQLTVQNNWPGIQNLHPQPGERQTYMTVSEPKNGLTDYALVSVWPGTLPGRHIMKLGGTHTWGTQGAVEYVTDLPSLRKLKSRIDATPGGWKEDVPLQILLEVHAKDDQVISVKYVTHHWLGA